MATTSSDKRAVDGSRYIVTCDSDWEHNYQIRELSELPTRMEKHAREFPGHVDAGLWRFERCARVTQSAPPHVEYVSPDQIRAEALKKFGRSKLRRVA